MDTQFDENCYYAHARSLLFDGDLDFANDYAFIVRTQSPFFAKPFADYLKERPKYPRNHFNIGTGLAALPFMATARCVDAVRCMVTGSPSAGGFSLFYVVAYGWACVTYGVGALWLAHGIALRWFDPRAAVFGVWAAALTSPFAFYLFHAWGMSHLTSAFFVTASLGAWLQWREAEGRAWWGWAAATGALVGFALCVRSASLPLGLLLAEAPLAAWRGRRVGLAVACGAAGVAAIAALAALSPQFAAWKILYGSWIANTVDFEGQLIAPHLLDVLVSRRHGLFFWSPFLIVAATGLIAALRRHPHPAVAFLVVLAGVTWIYGSWRVWWLGVSFGMRGFVDFVAIFAFGFAAVADWVWLQLRWRGLVVCWEALFLCALVNVHLSVAYRSGAVYVDGPLYWSRSFGTWERYREVLDRDWMTLTDFDPAHRTSLWREP